MSSFSESVCNTTRKIQFVTLLIVTLLSVATADCPTGGAPSSEDVRAELTHFIETYGFSRPTRSAVDPSRPWVCGAPNYDNADLLYFRGKTRNHSADGLEATVQKLVKTWEMEASHLKFGDWRTVSHKSYSIGANGVPPLKGEAAAREGNYNALLKGVDESLWSGETFESSHEAFRRAFPTGFPWKLLEVLSGPPRVVFSWRHWATFDGAYKGRAGDNKLYEMYGLAAVTVNEQLKVQTIEVFYKPDEFLRALQGEPDPAVLSRGASIFGTGKPAVDDEPTPHAPHSCHA